MSKTELSGKFFKSTRGKIVLQLRAGSMTVNDLAAALSLTDNAIRANLLSLERDRLIRQTGTIKGHRKPHFAYSLTEEARHLFPKAYDSLFSGLVTELKSRLRPKALMGVLRNVGKRIAGDRRPHGSLAERIGESVATLEELGGAPYALERDKKILIKSESCPFAEVVTEHPEVCQVAEAMVEEIVGVPVRETCDRKGTPKCLFEIEKVEALT
jgi:predicted ArsR family transcriptional regulator